jgi:hypothetical protein
MLQENENAQSVSSTPDSQQDNSAASEPSQPNAKQQEQVSPETLGQHFRSTVASKVQQSNAVTSARRAYSLTRGSAQAHGNKKVDMENRIQNIQKDKSGITRQQAKKQAHEDIKSEKKEAKNKQPIPEKSWAEQERETERKHRS